MTKGQEIKYVINPINGKLLKLDGKMAKKYIKQGIIDPVRDLYKATPAEISKPEPTIIPTNIENIEEKYPSIVPEPVTTENKPKEVILKNELKTIVKENKNEFVGLTQHQTDELLKKMLYKKLFSKNESKSKNKKKHNETLKSSKKSDRASKYKISKPVVTYSSDSSSSSNSFSD